MTDNTATNDPQSGDGNDPPAERSMNDLIRSGLAERRESSRRLTFTEPEEPGTPPDQGGEK
jgi:hypothetical protein